MALVGASGTMGQMFAFFSNRLGCLGSLLVSAVGTAAVVAVMLLVNAR